MPSAGTRRLALSLGLGLLLLATLLSSSETHQAVAKNVRRHNTLPELSTIQVPAPDTGSFLTTGHEKKQHESTCRNVHNPKFKDKCAFVLEHCTDEDLGFFNYLEFYYCSLGKWPIVAMGVMMLWMGMLFTTIGIAASDFFCVNLSTIASILGMSESMAGVTFLAFGNGSPDVFSTFAAMKINAGSLAVGELIGAASFITAVVAGSMAIVRPFKVARRPFIRDVCFFIVAVLFGIGFLADGEIHMWECAIMVLYYFSYVIFVCVWHWWSSRKRRIRLTESVARDHHVPFGEEETGIDGPENEEDGTVNSDSTSILRSIPDIRLLESQDDGEDDEREEEQEQQAYAELSSNMRVRGRFDGTQLPTTPHSIRPSLVGALEFRSVLNSLKKSQNLHGRPINLRRYSDNPAIDSIPQRYSAPGTLMQNTPVGSFNEQQSFFPPQRPGPSPNRARAVSVNALEGLHRYDGSAYTRGINEINHIPPTIIENSPTRGTGLTLTVPSQDFLAPPGARAPSTTASSPTSQISPTSHTYAIRGGHRSRGSEGGSPSLRVMESPSPLLMTEDTTIGGPPSPLVLGDNAYSRSESVIRDHIVGDTDSDHTLAIPGGPSKMRIFAYWPYHYLPPPQVLYSKLFPTLQGFADKTPVEKLIALIAVPSVFLLTITLPVVEESRESEPEITVNIPATSEEEQALMDESAATSTTSVSAFTNDLMNSTTTAATTTASTSEKGWNRWLAAVQCVCAPLFVTFIIFSNSDDDDPSTPPPSLLKPMLSAATAGLVALLAMLLTTSTHTPPKYHYYACYLGFVVAISWISTIANEVVGVLKAVGVIFNISDAILGLTIFAVGNSLGDLVADITIARLGFPVMALSACFGGPMLNILLGVGISGLVISATREGHAYRIEVSSTLIISAATLLVTLVFLLISVPMNRWTMSRRIGWTMIALWVVSTVVNLGVEVGGVGKTW